MQKIVGLCLILASVPAYGIKIGFFNSSAKDESFAMTFRGCNQGQIYTIGAGKSEEYVPPKSDKDCCIQKIEHTVVRNGKREGSLNLLADEAQLQTITSSNGSGGPCTGYCAVVIDKQGGVKIQGYPPR